MLILTEDFHGHQNAGTVFCPILLTDHSGHAQFAAEVSNVRFWLPGEFHSSPRPRSSS